MLSADNFERFREALRALPDKDRFERGHLVCDRFLLFSAGGLSAYYAPFHYLNRSARVVLIGLTPGWTQMELAFRAAKEGLKSRLSDEVLFDHISKAGSFGGPMRKILVGMLDEIGLNQQLGLASCNEMFEPLSGLVHFTSAVSAPIFKNGRNYTGYNPSLLNLLEFKGFIVENLARELALLPGAVIVPLGKVADAVLQFLQEENLISLDRCLTGFPHPSPANGHRKPQFDLGRERWCEQLASLLRD